jgi:spore germination protein
MVKRAYTALLMIILSLFIMGCWDRVELEERGFVIGVAIDAVKDQETTNLEQEEAPDKPKGKQRFVVTFQFVIPGALSGEKGGMSAKKGESSSEASFNISSEGDAMDTITTALATRTSRTPYFQHLQVVIVSEDVARNQLGFANVTDFFLRDQDMRRSVKILIAKGEARKVLEARPPNEKLPAMYIRSIAENTKKTTRMLPVSRFGDLDEHLLRGESFAIQRIVGHKQEVKIAGGAVFQGNTNSFIGFLGEEETEGLNFITGDGKRGTIKFKVQDNLVVYDIDNMKSKIKAVVNKKNEIQFTITVESEGTVGESFESLDFLKPNILRGLEIKAEEEIERLMKDTITKVQKDFKKDVFGFGAYLRGNHYDIWKQVRKDWDSGENYFAQSHIQVETKVKIRRNGIINKTEKRKEK